MPSRAGGDVAGMRQARSGAGRRSGGVAPLSLPIAIQAMFIVIPGLVPGIHAAPRIARRTLSPAGAEGTPAASTIPSTRPIARAIGIRRDGERSETAGRRATIARPGAGPMPRNGPFGAPVPDPDAPGRPGAREDGIAVVGDRAPEPARPHRRATRRSARGVLGLVGFGVGWEPDGPLPVSPKGKRTLELIMVLGRRTVRRAKGSARSSSKSSLPVSQER